MNARKVMAVTLATAMVVGSSMTVLAEDTANMTGSGSVEGYLDTGVISVDVPTDSSFSFILDPQGLLSVTSGARLETTKIDSSATVLFANTAEDATYDYSSTSDMFTLTNECTTDVDVTLTAKLTGNDNIGVSESSTFTSSDAEVYFALVSGATTEAITETTVGEGEEAVTTASATLTGTLAALDLSTDYTIGYDDGDSDSEDGDQGSSTPGYYYEVSDGFEADDDQKLEFQLTGASNADGDWSDATEDSLTLSVVWSFTEHTEAAPSIATTEYTMTSGSAVEITVDLGAGDLAATGISSITYTNSSGTLKALETSNYSFDATTGVLTLSESYISGVISAGVTSRAYTITFDDDADTAVSVTLKTA